MKESKKRLKADDLGMVTALHRTGEDWVITRVPVEFAKRVLEEEENIEHIGDYVDVGDSWCFETEEYTE
jgi:hypothetical protein|nr:MAG TPA: hypothetical protein [Bacteriophage sp.]